MSDKYHLRTTLKSLHRIRPGINPIMLSITRERNSEQDFDFNDPLFGKMHLRREIADELVDAGWCKIVQLDAHTEYLATTAAGKREAQS